MCGRLALVLFEKQLHRGVAPAQYADPNGGVAPVFWAFFGPWPEDGKIRREDGFYARLF
jgi:hypothetical protein